MCNMKNEAMALVSQLYQANRLSTDEHDQIFGALDEIELLRDRDEELEKLWKRFEDVSMNPETECIEEPFLGWGAGTHREEIWHWFDQRYSKGVAYLLYGGTEDYVPEAKRLYGLKHLCEECDTEDCAFNHGGECRLALVHERKPRITDVDGCIDYVYQAGDE